MNTALTLEFPDFLAGANAQELALPWNVERMRLVLDLARENVAARFGDETTAV